MRVFDSSALLAMIFQEPGGAKVAEFLAQDDAYVSAANLAETVSKLWDKKFDSAAVQAVLDDLPAQVQPLTRAQAIAAAQLRDTTRRLGLSVGDRCCLALAQELGAEVITADKPWKTLKGFRVTLIR
jgi:ribonuclease VapC